METRNKSRSKEESTTTDATDASEEVAAAAAAVASVKRQIPKYLDVSSLSVKELQDLKNIKDIDDRRQKILDMCTPIRNSAGKSLLQTDKVRSIVKMSFFEELASICTFAFGVPGAVVTIPALVIISGFLLKSFKLAAIGASVVLVPLMFVPVKFNEENLTSWWAVQILKYFSFKIIFEQQIKPNKPTILVAPPHGVFPFGNIITMIGFPSTMGHAFRGLAASAALRTPIFRQLLAGIGVIDASAKYANAALEKNKTIGISTGGVAEVFETNNKDQVIVLKSRMGIIKLAFRTGADLVPCYLYGNTELLSLYSGGSWHDFFCSLSRKIGFATIIFWGRFGLPIPYRIPILGVMSAPIPVPKKENPTEEEMKYYHNLLMDRMVELFDEHKVAYGWGDKKLVII